MGEDKPVGESIIVNLPDDGYLGRQNYLTTADFTVYLSNFYANNSIGVHNLALGSGKCKFSTSSTLETALMSKHKCVNGEIWHAC